MRLADISIHRPALCVSCRERICNPITAAQHRAHDHIVTDLESGERIIRIISGMRATRPNTVLPRDMREPVELFR